MANMTDAEIMAQLGAAKPLANYGERIGIGTHLLALKEYGSRTTTERGEILAADFVVLESTTHKPGTLIGCAWFIQDRGWQGEREISRAAVFLKELLGIEDAATMAREAIKLRDKSQPGTGIVIKCMGVKRKGDFVDPKWEHVPGQDGASVGKVRALMNSVNPAAPAAPPPVYTAPVYTAPVIETRAPDAAPLPVASVVSGGGFLASLK